MYAIVQTDYMPIQLEMSQWVGKEGEIIDKVSEITQRIFPDFYEIFSCKLHSNFLIIYNQNKEMGVFLQNLRCRHITNFSLSLLFLIAGMIQFIAGSVLCGKNQCLEGVILSVSGFVPVLLSFAFLRCSLKHQEKYPLIFNKIQAAEHEKKVLIKLLDLTNAVSDLCRFLDAFQYSPSEDKIQNLFLLLSKVQSNYSLFIQQISEISGTSDQNPYKEMLLPEKTDLYDLVFGKVAYLFLMDHIADLLKTSLLADSWKELKIAVHNDTMREKTSVEPWHSILIENPSAKTYELYFLINQKRSVNNLSQEIQKKFNLLLSDFFHYL